MKRQRRKKKLEIGKQFFRAMNFIKESKKEIYFVFFLFLFGSVIGFLFPERFSFLDEILRKLVSKTEGMGSLELIFFIFQNNLQSALFSLLGGIFLGIFPIISSLSNGIVLGYVLFEVWPILGFSAFLRLLPHGIFELTAIFIALGVGLKLGGFIFAKNKKKEFKRRFYESINVFLLIVLPLLIIAAIIEGLLIAFLS